MQIIPIAAAHQVPTLGVCLGMQAIAEHFGGTLRNLYEVLHGQATQLTSIQPVGIFEGLSAPLQVGHYHSWVIDDEELPKNLVITARNAGGLPMALTHRHLPIQAVQFHPESVLTPIGKQLIRTWIDQVKVFRKSHPIERTAIPVWRGPMEEE